MNQSHFEREADRQRVSRLESDFVHPRSDWAGISANSLAAGSRSSGDFVVGKTSNTVTIEGFLFDNRGSDRSSHERKLQAQVQQLAPDDGRQWDASHLVAHMFGGHGLDNLVPMLKRLNISYLGAVEKGFARELSTAEVYARVTVRFGSDGLPDAIIHECFTRANDREVNKVFEVKTKLNWDPYHDSSGVSRPTLAGYLERIGERWKDWVGHKMPKDAVVQ